MTCKAITPLVSRYSSAFVQPRLGIDDISNFTPILDLQNDPLAKYDAAQVLDITNKLQSLSKKVNYPTLTERVNQGPLNIYEVAQFLDQTQYNPTELQKALTPQKLTADATEALVQLDYYFNNNLSGSIGGGLCGAFGNAFAKISGLIGLASSLASSLDALLNVDFSVLALLQGIKSNILKIVDDVANALKTKVKNIAKQLSGFADSVSNAFNKTIAGIQDFLSDLSIDGLKKTIEGVIAKAAGCFENLTLKKVALLMFRFCQFADLIQGFMEGPTNNLVAKVAKFKIMDELINRLSNDATASAVNAGAKRVTEDVRKTQSELIRQRIIEIESAREGTPLEDIEETTLPDIEVTPLPDQDPNPSFKRPTTWPDIPISEEEKTWVTTITESGAPGYFDLTESVKRMHSRATDHYKKNGSVLQKRIYEVSHHFDGSGWRNQNLAEVWIRLKRVIDRFGEGPMKITSAYRSEYYNAFISPGKGKTSSQHSSGKAIDVYYGQLAQTQRYELAKFASQEGFTGIGVYSSFIHLDIRPHGERTYWIAGYTPDAQKNSESPVPRSTFLDWETVLMMHKANLFRNG